MIIFRFLALFLGQKTVFFQCLSAFSFLCGMCLVEFCQIQWHAHFQHDLTAGKPLLISEAVTRTHLPRTQTRYQQTSTDEMRAGRHTDWRIKKNQFKGNSNKRKGPRLKRKRKTSKTEEFKRAQDAHVHAWMSYICVCALVYTVEAKKSLSAGDAFPLWCSACGFLVRPVKRHSIISTDTQMCSAGRCTKTQGMSCWHLIQLQNSAVGWAQFDAVL